MPFGGVKSSGYGRFGSRAVIAEYWGGIQAPLSAGQPPSPLLNAGPCRAGLPGGRDGRIAQLVEQLTLNQRVQGSSPCAPTIDFNDLAAIRAERTANLRPAETAARRTCDFHLFQGYAEGASPGRRSFHSRASLLA
jgi:hypothetical protein